MEYIGLLCVFCVLIYNHEAWVLIEIALKKYSIVINDVIMLFECLLCFEQWCCKPSYWAHSTAVVEEVNTKNAIKVMLDTLMNTFPCNHSNGWALSKVHDHLHVLLFITKYGTPMNYNTEFCEHNHKYQAKIPRRQTAK